MWKERKKERRKNNAKFSGHYFRQRTHNVRAHALRSHQLLVFCTHPTHPISQGTFMAQLPVSQVLHKEKKIVLTFKKNY